MRITYIHQHFRTPTMAGGTRSFEFARRLANRGHFVDVIASRQVTDNAESTAARLTTEAGFAVHWIDVPYGNEMSYRRRMKAFAHFATAATRLAARLPSDLVFASSTPLTVAVPGICAAARRNVPFVFEVRDVWPEVPIALGALRNPILRRAALRLESIAYKRSEHIIALSPDMASSITSRFPMARVTVIPNACNLELFSGASAEDVKQLRERHQWLGSRPLVIYAGTLGRVNGVSYIVEMAASTAATHPDVRFLILGRGAEGDLVRKLASIRGVLNRNLFMLDQIPKIEMPAHLAAADLALSTVIDVPALAANSANKVFDALAAGTPVGVNHGGWLAKLLVDTGAGIVLPAKDPSAAGFLAASFVSDARKQSAARSAASAVASTRFSLDLLFEQFEEVILTAGSSPIAPHPTVTTTAEW